MKNFEFYTYCIFEDLITGGSFAPIYVLSDFCLLAFLLYNPRFLVILRILVTWPFVVDMQIYFIWVSKSIDIKTKDSGLSTSQIQILY